MRLRILRYPRKRVVVGDPPSSDRVPLGPTLRLPDVVWPVPAVRSSVMVNRWMEIELAPLFDNVNPQAQCLNLVVSTDIPFVQGKLKLR
jgi:hypothetical protein